MIEMSVDVDLSVDTLSQLNMDLLDTELNRDLSIDGVYAGGGGTKDYEKLKNKPRIEDVELVGNKELGDFGMNLASEYDIAMLFR